MTTLAIPCLLVAFLSKSRAAFYIGMALGELFLFATTSPVNGILFATTSPVNAVFLWSCTPKP
ncbi:hypothetical protein T484DRAFT_1773917 [Baffinella frigidus]|nr:hypothetical protein T484DRAFT_1773917 [Cryptophyta sp. CCMP2293]